MNRPLADTHEVSPKAVAASPSPQPISTRVDLWRLPDPCTSAELATVLCKSSKTIVDWCEERDYTHIPCFRLGNRWYHRPAELIRWLNGIKSGHVEFRRKPRISAERK